MPTVLETNDWNSYMDGDPSEEGEEQVSAGRGMPSLLQESAYLFALPALIADEGDLETLPESPGQTATPDNLLTLRLENLPLSTSTTRALRKAGFRTLQHLINLSQSQLAELPDLGRKALREIEELLEALELSQAPALPEWDTPIGHEELIVSVDRESDNVPQEEIQAPELPVEEPLADIVVAVVKTQLALPMESVAPATRRCRVCRKLFLPEQEEQRHCSAECDLSAFERKRRNPAATTLPENIANQFSLEL